MYSPQGPRYSFAPQRPTFLHFPPPVSTNFDVTYSELILNSVPSLNCAPTGCVLATLPLSRVYSRTFSQFHTMVHVCQFESYKSLDLGFNRLAISKMLTMCSQPSSTITSLKNSLLKRPLQAGTSHGCSF